MGDAHNTLGVVLAGQARHDEALAEFRAAVRLAPRSVEALNNLSNALSQAGRHDEALPALQEALALDPQLAEAHYNLATVLQVLKRHDEAAAALARAVELAPRMSYALGHLVWNKLAVCSWDGIEARIEALRAQVREGIAAEPFAFLAVSSSPEEQRLCARAHAREQLVAGAPAPAPARRGGERIRVAYLSADYCEHATAYLAAGLFERHDRRQLEVIGLSYGADDGSPMRRRLERAFDRFVDVRMQGDEEAARLLHELAVDIAVDLKGYTTGARPGILARRPAPVQAAWLGYPGTLGSACIDYVIADRTVVPDGAQAFYDEQVVYLPDCYQVNDSARAIAEYPASRAPSRAGAGLPEAGFVFCCFNNSYKIAPPVFALWMRLLAAVPGSVLWLLEDSATAAENLRRAACAAGVDPARLVFAGRLPHPEHLARHRLADLFLDTLPYNAHTTGSDALWAGLPVLTCAGTTFAGRVAASLLRAVGLPELITSSADEYMALALALARDPGRLVAVRAKLARNRTSAPLFDTGRFARAMESAYRTMSQACLRGERPRGFAVEGI